MEHVRGTGSRHLSLCDVLHEPKLSTKQTLNCTEYNQQSSCSQIVLLLIWTRHLTTMPVITAGESVYYY